MFTAEEKPGFANYYMCMGIDRKTLHIKDYNGETGIQIHKRFVKNLVDIEKEEARIEERFSKDINERRRFEWSIGQIRKNLGG